MNPYFQANPTDQAHTRLVRATNVATLAISSGVSGGRLNHYIDRIIEEWRKQ